MDPAGGFAEPVARFARLALQHHNLSRALTQLRAFRTQPARRPQAGIDTPFVTELADIPLVAPDWLKYIAVSKPMPPQPIIATFAPTGALSRKTSVAEHLGMIDPDDRRQARGDAGGEDRLIERQQIVCRDAGVQT